MNRLADKSAPKRIRGYAVQLERSNDQAAGASLVDQSRSLWIEGTGDEKFSFVESYGIQPPGEDCVRHEGEIFVSSREMAEIVVSALNDYFANMRSTGAC